MVVLYLYFKLCLTKTNGMKMYIVLEQFSSLS